MMNTDKVQCCSCNNMIFFENSVTSNIFITDEYDTYYDGSIVYCNKCSPLCPLIKNENIIS